MNYYQLLKIPSDADQEQIESAYRKLMPHFHAHAKTGHQELAQTLYEAYRILSIPQNREAYDQSLKELEKASRAAGQEKSASVVYHNAQKGAVEIKFEKRALSRIPIDMTVYYRSTAVPAYRQIRLKDLSGSGARLEGVLDLPLNQLIELSTHPDQLPFALAQIMRKDAKKRQCGVRWIQLYDESQLKGILAKKKF